MSVSKYQLEKDSFVEVHKIFGNKYYFALVDLKGRYPEDGKIAHDINRQEYIYVLKGNMDLVVNGKKYSLNKSQSQLIKSGDKYYIKGNGKAIVFVEDGNKGASAIEPLTKE